MIPAFLIGAGIGYVAAHYIGSGKSSGLLNLKSPMKPPVAGFGVCTPARARLHAHFLANEHNPDKLMRAANLYSQVGLDPQASSLATKAKDVIDQANVAAELVERSRAGDQNAIGMITAIRDSATNGSLRAKISSLLIEDYIHEHPVVTPPPLLSPIAAPPVVPPPVVAPLN
jgi:hypothetical protein